MRTIKMNYELNAEQRQSWEKNGYVVLRDFFAADIKQNLAHWCDELTALPETPGKWMKYFERNAEGDRQLCRVENFIDYHSSFNDLVRGERTLKLLSDLMTEPATIFK